MYRINVMLRYRYYENCNGHLWRAIIFSMTMYSTEIEAMKLNATLNLFKFIY